jgi:uncharacterized membrane protein YeaQ/YmgE (transglycosylase-associated protein family)
MLDPFVTFLIVLLIGIAAGLLAQRYFNSSWILKQLGGRRRTVTSALVGIAGSFIGFHIGILLGLLGALILFLCAALGAALVLWGWRGVGV